MAYAPAPPAASVEAPPAAVAPGARGRLGALPLPLLAAALGLFTILSRIPFRSRYLFSWDSANFALALERYNVAFHQPQPPGYPLYVASARALLPLLGEANASYVALSVLGSGVAVAAFVMAGARLLGRTTALLAAVLLATSSVFWSQGEVAYPYIFLALFSSLVAWLCLVVRAGGRRAGTLTVLGGGLIGVAAGYRSELLPFLMPLWLSAGLVRPGSVRGRLRAIAGGGLLMFVAVLAWYIPMVQLSGGWAAYQTATGGYYAYFIQSTSGVGKLLLGLLENTRAIVGFLYNGLGLALLPALYYLGRFFSPQRVVQDWRVRFLLLWLLPPLVFYVTVHIGNPGYVLSFLPALCLYVAAAVLGLCEDVRQAAVLLSARWPQPALPLPPAAPTSPAPASPPVPPAALVSWGTSRLARALEALGRTTWIVTAATLAVLAVGASNAVLFVVATGEGRYREIRQIDNILSRQVAYVQARFPAGSTVLFAYDRSRQYRYYLPAHRIELLFDVAVAGAVTDTSRYWERRTLFVVPDGITAVLFPDLSQNTSDEPGLVARVDLGEGVALHFAAVRPGDEVRYGYQYASARRVG